MTPEMNAELREKRYNATVVYLRKVHSDLMVLRVKPDTPKQPHLPGQYCTLGLGNWEPRMPGCQEEHLKEGDESKLVLRSYSLSCPLLDPAGNLVDYDAQEWLEFYIVLVRQTDNPEHAPALTPRLFMLREGDRLSIGKKITGHYTSECVKPTDNVIFLGTGTGEAPHNYMLWHLLRQQHQGKILSACCVRLKQDLAYLSTHTELMKRYPNYRYLALTTREPNNTGRKVYIQDTITSGQLEEELGAPLDPRCTHVFLCGNPKMIGVPTYDKETDAKSYPQPLGVIEILEQRGFACDRAKTKFKGNIHFEEYW